MGCDCGAFLSRDYPTESSFFDGPVYQRFVSYGDANGIIEVSPVGEKFYLRLRVPVQLWEHIPKIIDQARQLFDLDADPARIVQHLRTDSLLAPYLDTNQDVRVPGAWDPFELSVRTILGQQVTVTAATTLCSRLIRRWGKQTGGEAFGWEFPPARILARADVASIGIPKSRAQSIAALAEAIDRKFIAFDGSISLTDFLIRMKSLPGIGAWTANYVAMRALKEPDAFPIGDLGVKKSLTEHESVDWSNKKIRERAARWQPWRSYATMILWGRLSLTAKEKPDENR